MSEPERKPFVLVDGTTAGCVCLPKCEWPCWQRVGHHRRSVLQGLRTPGPAPAGGAGMNRYGFDWGPAAVTRWCALDGGRRVVQIKTPFRTLHVYVSATGRSVRVFEAGAELTPQNDKGPAT